MKNCRGGGAQNKGHTHVFPFPPPDPLCALALCPSPVLIIMTPFFLFLAKFSQWKIVAGYWSSMGEE